MQHAWQAFVLGGLSSYLLAKLHLFIEHLDRSSEGQLWTFPRQERIATLSELAFFGVPLWDPPSAALSLRPRDLVAAVLARLFSPEMLHLALRTEVLRRREVAVKSLKPKPALSCEQQWSEGPGR